MGIPNMDADFMGGKKDMRLFVGGPCGIGKGAIVQSLADTLKMLNPDCSVRVIEDPIEAAAQERGFTFERLCARRLYVRGPDICEEMIYSGLDRMLDGDEDYVLVNESPFAFLGYCTYFGFLACLSIERRNALIRRFVSAGAGDESRHLFVQPWQRHPDDIAAALNVVIVPYASLAGSNGEILPVQKDRNKTVKAGAMMGLNLLEIQGGDA